MKAEVRDDLIKLETFVVAKFKFEKYIMLIHEAGGYCFLGQFEEHFGKSKGRYIIEQLVKNGFIKTKAYSNYKYCYLTSTSIKYIRYKDSEEDFSNISKDKISCYKIVKNASDKVLFSSSIKFALIQRNELIGKTKYEAHLKNFFKKFYEFRNLREVEEDVNKLKNRYDERYKISVEIFNDYLKPLYCLYAGEDLTDRYNKLSDELKELEFQLEKSKKTLFNKNSNVEIRILEVKNELNELSIYKKLLDLIKGKTNKLKTELREQEKSLSLKKNEFEILKKEKDDIEIKISSSVKKCIEYYDKSKIIFLPNESKLVMMIIDTGTLKKASSYIKILNDFVKITALEKLELEIKIISYSKNRTIILQEEFNKLIKKRKEAIKRADEYEELKRLKHYKYEPQYYKTSKIIMQNTPKFTITYDDVAFYMNAYKQNIGQGTEYIKSKDKDRFEEIKKSLRGKENEEKDK